MGYYPQEYKPSINTMGTPNFTFIPTLYPPNPKRLHSNPPPEKKYFTSSDPHHDISKQPR